MSKAKRPVVIEAMEPRVLFDASQLTETIVSSTLPATITNASVLHGKVTIEVANESGMTQQGKFSVDALIANGALDLSGTNFGILTFKLKKISLANGQSKLFTLPIHVPPGKLALAVNTLYAVVADPSNAHSQSPPGPTLNVTVAPILFSDKILSAKPAYVAGSLADSQEYADQLVLKMSIHNNGALSNGSDDFTLFASASPTFDSSAAQIGQMSQDLIVSHNGVRNFSVDFSGLPDLGGGSGAVLEDHIFVQMTDTAANVTLASFPKLVKLAL